VRRWQFAGWGYVMTHLLELFTVFVIQLFIVVDPVAGIPVFLTITPNKGEGERRALARRGCSIGCLIIIFFLAGGHQVLTYFGIQTSAVQICGGILLFVIFPGPSLRAGLRHRDQQP